MSLRTQHEFLFVGRDEGSFVENYAYDIGEGGDNSGKIYINIEIQNNPAEAEALGEVIFDTLRKGFFADLERDPYERFEEAVRLVNKALQKVKEEKASDYLGNLHVLIAAIVDNTLYLTQSGEAEAYLVRKRLCSTVSEGLGEEDGTDYFANIASGTLEPGDLVLLSSTRMLRYVSKTDLAKILSGRNLVSSLGELKDYMMTEVLGRIGFIGIGIAEGAPRLTQTEKGQIEEHLEKEESYSAAPPPRKRGEGSAMKDALNRLTGSVDDLRRRVSALASSRKGGVTSPTVRQESGGRMVAGFTKEQIMALIIAGVLLLTLVVWWLRAQGAEQEKIQSFDATLNEVQETISSAETTGQFNKDQAGEMLIQAESKAVEVLNSGYHRAKANELLEQIQDARNLLDGVVHPEYRVIANLAEKRENVSALGLLELNDILYAYEYNALYPIILDEVQDPLTIDDNETVIAGTVYDEDDSLLFYTKSGKVMEFKDNRVTFVDTTDGAFKNGVAVHAYSNRFYVLDPSENQIWRYTRRRDSFDAAEAYNVNAEIQNGVDLATDINVYVLNNDGFITKLFSGNREDFPIKKEPTDPVESPTKIYTEVDMGAIYVLEPGKKRVLVYFKDDRTGGATYNRQMVFDDLGEIRDMWIDKDTNKIYLLDETQVYEAAL